jgi:uncharacterized protein (TIGR03437 family)
MSVLKHLPVTTLRSRHVPRVVSTLLALASGLFAQTSLTLRVSSETAPPGSTAQIKIYAATPSLVTAANFSLDFDPQVFDGIASVAAFSASGDQIGYANVNGQHLDAHFRSSSGGIGQLRSLPVFVVSVRVLASAPAGTTRAITLTPTVDANGIGWNDTQGDALAVTVTPGTFTVGGSLSVTSIVPGGGLLPAATVLAIQGAGFQAETTVAIDGVPIASTKYVSPTEIELTLGGQTELTGKHVSLSNPSGETVDYFAALPSAPAPLPPSYKAIPNVQPILPLTTYTAVEMGTPASPMYNSQGVAMLNPNAIPVTVSLVVGYNLGVESNIEFNDTLTLPPGGLYFFDVGPLPLSEDLGTALWITGSAPLRFGLYTAPLPVYGPTRAPTVTPLSPAYDPPPTQVTLEVSPPSVSWSWQKGSAAPAPAQVRVLGNGSFTVSAPPAASWLTVTPKSGTVSETAFAALTLTPNLAGLNPGTYTATVTITPAVQPPYTEVPSTITVTVTVTAAAQLTVLPSCCLFVTPASSAPAQTVTVSSNGDPVAFTAAVVPGTGGSWLNVTPLSGNTPANLTLTISPVGLPFGQYSSQIVIQGPNGTLTVPVTLMVIPPPPPPPPPASGIQVSPGSLAFVLTAGSPAPMLPQVITIHPNGISFTANTQGGNWMSTALFANDYQTVIQVNASAVGLSPGTYWGTISITLDPYTPVQIPVSLVVLPAPTSQTRIIATPPSLTLNAPAGQGQTQSITLDSGSTPVLFSFSQDTSQDSQGTLGWFFSATEASALNGPNNQAGTPATITVSANATLPGSYHQTLNIEWATGSISVPVTFNAGASAMFPPVVSGVLNAASLVPGPIASGEMITMLGTGIGPSPQVLIHGAPATVLYASGTQVNAVVPSNLDAQGTASLQVICDGAASQTWDLPLAPSVPGIFSIDSTGAGQGIVLNQDGSLNSPSNPASRGSTVQIYATGGGLNLPVTATIGGIDGKAQFAAPAPNAAAGLFQVDAPVPQAVTPGSALPVTITIGNARSADGITISVR